MSILDLAISARLEGHEDDDAARAVLEVNHHHRPVWIWRRGRHDCHNCRTAAPCPTMCLVARELGIYR